MSAADPIPALQHEVGVLDTMLGEWIRGDRRALNHALDAIDTMLARLYRLRDELVSEMRTHDDRAAEQRRDPNWPHDPRD